MPILSVPPGDCVTVAAYAVTWLNRHSASVKPVTIARYAFHLHKYVLPELGTALLSALRPALIRRALDTLTIDKGLSTATWRAGRIVLSALLSDAVQRGVIEMNPALGLRIRGKSVRKRIAYQPTQLALFLRTAARERPDVAPIFVTCAIAGLRISEALALRVEDVDVDGRLLHVARTIAANAVTIRGKRTRPVDAPKGNRGRILPLAKSALEALRPLVENRQGWLFPGRFGEPRCYSSVRAIAVGIARRAGVPPNGTHVLRRSFANANADKVSARQLRDLLGHALLSTTDHYIRDLTPVVPRPPHFDHS